MTIKTSLRTLAGRALRASGAAPAAQRMRHRLKQRSHRRLIAELADEFGARPATMTAFAERFAPVLVAPNRFREDADVMLFVHIPKTAGVSVGKALQQSFDRFLSVAWDDVVASFTAQTHDALYHQTRGRSRQVLMGHFGWHELRVWHYHELPVKCGTILRDPVDRLVSNYNYNCSEMHPAREAFAQRFPTIGEYAQDGPTDVQLTQAVGRISSFDNALEKLTRHYSFIGATERLAQSLAHLSRSHGLPPIAEYRANAGAAPQEGQRAAVAELVRARNHNDCKLHALMLRLYDLPDV